MASLFPIGTIAQDSDSGTIDGVSYALFEPNAGCSVSRMYNVLTTMFENKTLSTRKKAEPYITVTYNYNNIFSREYLQIEHFIDSVAEDALNSFFVVDFSHGQSCSITSPVTNWVVAIDNTRLYSAIANQRADNAVLWDGSGSFMLSDVVTVTTNTSITLDYTTYYGNLSEANADSYGMLFPVYTVYAVPNSLSGFKPTEYWDDDISLSHDGGYMYSGSIGFIGKYRV